MVIEKRSQNLEQTATRAGNIKQKEAVMKEAKARGVKERAPHRKWRWDHLWWNKGGDLSGATTHHDDDIIGVPQKGAEWREQTWVWEGLLCTLLVGSINFLGKVPENSNHPSHIETSNFSQQSSCRFVANSLANLPAARSLSVLSGWQVVFQWHSRYGKVHAA